jgi:predicted dinucleotide-binding enzyme
MNPLDFSGGFPPKLSITGADSLGERVQRALPDAKVVKALNTIGNAYFVDPKFSEGEPTMLIAGEDEGAKRTVGDVLADLGWSDTVDIGGIEGARARGDLHRVGQDRRRTGLVGPRVQAACRLTLSELLAVRGMHESPVIRQQ